MASRNWAGDFECCDCRRKRLTAASFSKSMANKRRADPYALIRCLECVAKRAQEERAAALAKSNAAANSCDTNSPDSPADAQSLQCSACQRDLPLSSFSAKQRRKQAGARCSECVTTAEAEERIKNSQASVDALRNAQESSIAAAGGSARDRLAAAANETAEEASFVTGLKPVKLGRGRGSWRSRARGRGASRQGRGRGS